MRMRLCLLVGVVLAAGWAARADLRATTGPMEVVTPPPSLAVNAYQSDTTLRVMKERTSFALAGAVKANITMPGSYAKTSELTSQAVIPAGTVVNSYLIHGDNQTIQFDLTAGVEFEEEIVGVTVLFADLNASDPICKAPGTTYPTGAYDRGLEFWGPQATDSVTLGADRRTLTVRFVVFGVVDQVRVLTKASESKVVATPVILALPGQVYFPDFTAMLTDAATGKPLGGRTISFGSMDGATLYCSTTTAPDGSAGCSNPTSLPQVLLDGGYNAVFTGDPYYVPSSDKGPLLNVAGTDLP